MDRMTVNELYTKIYPVQDIALRKRLVNLTKGKKLKKNEFLFKQDEIDKSIYFLKAGVVTSSEIHQNGKANCLGVFFEPGEILVGGLGPGSPYSPINAVARTACEVYELPMSDLYQIMGEYSETILMFYNQILLKEYEKQWQIKNMLYLETAEERYKWFLIHYPGVIDKISHELIASFLHMSPVTLSRVRKTIR